MTHTLSLGLGILMFMMTWMAMSDRALAKCDEPLPEFSIPTPGPAVAREYVKFVGVWRGEWDSGRCGAMAIALLDDQGKVEITITWSPSKIRSRKYDSSKFTARINNDGELKFGRAKKFFFTRSDDSTLEGSMAAMASRDHVTMKKVK